MTLARFNKKYVLIALVFLIVLGGLFYAFTAFGVTRTWDGGGGDANWHTPANWSGDTVPGGSDIAAFDGTCVTNCSPTMNGVVSVAGIDMGVGYTATITQSSTSTLTVGSSHWVQAGGTFIGGTSTIDINGTFTLSGGTFTSTAGTLEVGYSVSDATIFTISGGTFNHSNGTAKFVFGESGNTRVYTIDVATSLTLYDVEWASTDTVNPDALTAASGDMIIVANNFTQTNGQISGTWEVQGNVIIGAGADGGMGTLTYTGTGSKTYAYSSGGLGPHLRVNNAAVSVSAAGGTSALSVSFFSLLAGTFTAPTGMFQIGFVLEGDYTVFSVSSGTFIHNEGSIKFIFGGSGNSRYYTIDVATSLTFYNVEWATTDSQNNDILNVATGDTIIVEGNFTQTKGVLGFAGGSWEVQGNYTVGANAAGGTASTTFSGGNNQTYTDNGGNEPDGDVLINKTGGTVTLASNAEWNATNQDLTITSGTLAQSSYNITTNNFTVNGGTFAGGSGSITLSRILTLSAGSFVSTSGTLSFDLPSESITFFNQSGGTFNHGNGTVFIFENNTLSGSTWLTYTIDTSAPQIMNNMTVDLDISGYGNSQTLAVASGDNLITNGTLTLSEGILAGAIEARGDITHGSGFAGGTGTITLAADSNQTITGNDIGILPNIIIDKSGGTVRTSAVCSMQTLVLTSGTFIAPATTLYLGSYGNVIDQDNMRLSTATLLSGNPSLFVHNGGSVYIRRGLYDQSEYTTNTLDGAFEFWNLSCDVVASGYGEVSRLILLNGITINNTFTLIDGKVDNNNLSILGNVIIGAGADGGNASTTFTDGGTQTYTDNGGNEPDGDVTINKTANAVVLNSNADWNSAGQDLTITSGTLLQRGTTSVSTGAVTVGASGKWIANGTGTTTLGGNLVNNGLIDYLGNNSCGGADILKLRSSSGGSQRAWSGSGTTIMRDVDVKDQGGSLAITANSCTNTSGNGANWTFTDACVFVGPDLVIPNTPMRIGSGRTVIQ